MTTITNTLSKIPATPLTRENIFALFDRTWRLRGAPQPIVPFLRGGYGIGKTQFVYAWVREMQKKHPTFKVWDIMMADKYPNDLVAQVPDMVTKTVIGYLNEQLAEACDPNAFGVIFWDEFTQAMLDTQKVASKAVNERKFGVYSISPNVIQIMAGNRHTDKSGASKMLAMMSNRIDTIDVEVDNDALIDYYIDVGHNPLFAAYLNSAPYEEARDFKPQEDINFTPRSFERVAEKWTDADPMGDGGVVLSLGDIASSIGIGRAREFRSFAEMVDKMPSRQEIILDPASAKVPDRLDERCAVACMLTVSTTDKTFAKYSQYIQRFPVSLQILYLKLVLKRDDGAIRRMKEFTQWLLKKDIKDAILDRLS
jgi:hypothetical protein